MIRAGEPKKFQKEPQITQFSGRYYMSTFLKFLKVLAIISIAFFGITFTVYIFNLDMKLTAAIEPLLLKHYDKIERDQHL